MKWHLLLLIAVPWLASAQVSHPPHLDLQASSTELLRLLHSTPQTSQSDGLDDLVRLGELNLRWLETINSQRSEPIRFTSPETNRSIPITDPEKYSPQILRQKWAALLTEMPEKMKRVLTGSEPISNELPADEKVYIEMGRRTDRIYQGALRWRLLSPHLAYYEGQRIRDIRGIYFLSQEKDLSQSLRMWGDLSDSKRAQLKQWLTGVCFHSLANSAICESRLNTAIQAGRVESYFLLYRPRALAMLDSFYKIQSFRSEFKWNEIDSTMSVFVRTLAQGDRTAFAKANLEAEFQWGAWRLKAFEVDEAQVQVHWVPGVTPHVNRLGGDQLFMDANVPLTEWDPQWIIRHEFGHILGLPDCYHEFYDAQEKVMINYQIDVDDLMCSRTGRMNERILSELRRVYGTQTSSVLVNKGWTFSRAFSNGDQFPSPR